MQRVCSISQMSKRQRHNINQKLMKGKLKIIKIYQMKMEDILCMEIY